MLYELYDLSLAPQLAAVVLGALLGLAFGAAGQISRFCLRRGLVGQGSERRSALGVWVAALLTALVGTQAAAAYGLIDLSAHRFASADLPYLAVLLGGLSFGIGMVLTRGCVSRLTVLSGTGNLRAVVVLATFAIVAHATLKGVLAPVRVGIGSITAPLGDGALASGWVGGPLLWSGLLALGLAVLILRSGARVRDVGLAGLIGLLVPLGWIGTGVLLFDEFDPIALETLSFTAPWADTLFWTIASTAIPAGFGTGLVGGVVAGSFLAAALRGQLVLASFETPAHTLRYLAGGALMGFGGVLAGGCTVGAGLSGVSGLSVAAALALAAMIAGARIADLLVDHRRPLSGAAEATPAE